MRAHTPRPNGGGVATRVKASFRPKTWAKEQTINPVQLFANGTARETGLEPATSGGRMENLHSQRDMELLGQKNSHVGLLTFAFLASF